MKTSDAVKLHPLKEIAHPWGREIIRNFGPGDTKIYLEWNPSLSQHGVFRLRFEDKEMLIDAEEMRSVTRVF